MLTTPQSLSWYPCLAGSQPVHETLQERNNLRQALGLSAALQQREVLRIGDLHCELYPHASEAPLIIFLPGITTYVELYAVFLTELQRQGFNVLAVDLPGHGYSGGARGDYRVGQVLKALQSVLDIMQQRFSEPVGIYGYSIGALLAVALAERDARVRSVLCGTLLVPDIPPDFFHQFGWQWLSGTALLMPRMRLPLRQLLDLEALLTGRPAAGLMQHIRNDSRMVYDYPVATLASLFSWRLGVVRRAYTSFMAAIVHGEHDEVLPASYSQRLVNRLQHPFKLMTLRDEGHMLPWDNPAVMAALAAGWFAGTLT